MTIAGFLISGIGFIAVYITMVVFYVLAIALKNPKGRVPLDFPWVNANS